MKIYQIKIIDVITNQQRDYAVLFPRIDVIDLECDRAYVVTISARNACGLSDESEPIYFIAGNQGE